ncbi:hypothetical protein KDAU_36890 [Dictyobacter aurantiacus]|uniref:Uncharacterized protein n=1 Tax=Dictyobacter aurantiacus TaxID=1936993 RepID=A0A401ZHK3_9CHLR|nr:hypothetical protein KDAU_36890 [Dictyobacter aurantiacus]
MFQKSVKVYQQVLKIEKKLRAKTQKIRETIHTKRTILNSAKNTKAPGQTKSPGALLISKSLSSVQTGLSKENG